MGKSYKRLTDAQIIQGLNASGGMVYHAAAALGCSAQTIYDRRDKSEAIAQAIEDSRGDLLDLAELALKKAVKAGEAWAVCFTLKTVGKARGYIERTELEHTGKGGGPVAIDLDAWRRDLGLSGGGDGSDR